MVYGGKKSYEFYIILPSNSLTKYSVNSIFKAFSVKPLWESCLFKMNKFNLNIMS